MYLFERSDAFFISFSFNPFGGDSTYLVAHTSVRHIIIRKYISK